MQKPLRRQMDKQSCFFSLALGSFIKGGKISIILSFAPNSRSILKAVHEQCKSFENAAFALGIHTIWILDYSCMQRPPGQLSGQVMACDSFCRAFLSVLSPSHTLSSRAEAEIAALSTLTASLAGRFAVGIDHCGLIFHPVGSQHMLIAHNQILCWFSALSCIPIQKCVCVAAIHLEIHFFRNPFIIQTCTNIQLQTCILKVFWKC